VRDQERRAGIRVGENTDRLSLEDLRTQLELEFGTSSEERTIAGYDGFVVTGVGEGKAFTVCAVFIDDLVILGGVLGGNAATEFVASGLVELAIDAL